MTKQVAIILSGSGVYDGSEIHETVLTLLALEQAGIKYKTFAPNIEQAHVINHFAGQSADNEKRNVLVESNRLSRGNCEALSKLDVTDFDALVFVGGFGAAKNLCSFAFDGEGYGVLPEINQCIQSFNQNNKWILAMCISPVILAKVIENSAITIGSDMETIKIIENATTAKHIECSVLQHHIDETHKLITTPAYMLATNLVGLEQGISGAVKALATKI